MLVVVGAGALLVGSVLAGLSRWDRFSAAPTSPHPPTGSPDQDGGLLGGIVEDLLGGMDPTRLARCLGTPSGRPEPLPDDPDAAIDAIADQVVRERGLEFTDPVAPVLLAPDDLRDRIVELSADDYPAADAEVDARLLAGLGAIPPDTDLRALQLELLGDQVAGFYDPDTSELTAVATDGLDPTTRMTLAHEVDHALTDQALGLPDLDGFAGRSDEALAVLAVIEGDASLLMQRWAVQQLTLVDQLAAAAAGLGATDQLAATPWVLQQRLVFPYTTGLAFACERFAEGGWSAIDELYTAALPRTSAQVMWPERHAAGELAVDVPDPALPAGWEEVRRDQVGAADLLWLFQAPGDDRTARLSDSESRARAWAGGEVVVGTRGDDTAITVSLAEHDDAPQPLCASVTEWYARAFPQAHATTTTTGTAWTDTDQAAVVACGDGRVRLGIGPDADTARAAASG